MTTPETTTHTDLETAPDYQIDGHSTVRSPLYQAAWRNIPAPVRRNLLSIAMFREYPHARYRNSGLRLANIDPLCRGVFFLNKTLNYSIIASWAKYPVEDPESWWFHVSIARSKGKRQVNYDELTFTKHAFIGDDRIAIQVFPVMPELVNDHTRCLHLFAPLEPFPLPDFRFPLVPGNPREGYTI